MTKNLPEKKPSPQQALMEAFKTDLENVTPYLETMLPDKGAVTRFKQMTLLAIMRSPNLLTCNQRSLLLALLWCAQKDLEPGVDDGAWLIPFKGIVVPIPAYKGLIKKATETGSVTDVDPQGVYEHDVFEYSLGADPHLLHQPPKLGSARGKLIGAYVVITKPDGSKRFKVLGREDVEKIRNAGAAWKAKPGEGPWHDWEEAMFLKTLVKQGLKYIPVKPILRDLLSDDGRIEAGESVAALLQQSGADLPASLTEPEVQAPEPAPDTSEFDKLVEAQSPDMEQRAHLDANLALVAATKKMTVPQFKAWVTPYFAAVEGDPAKGYWAVFLAWEAKKYPPADEAEQSEPEQEENQAEATTDQREPQEEPESGEAPFGFTEEAKPEQSNFTKREAIVWYDIIQKNIPLTDLATLKISGRGDITEANIDALEELIKNFKAPAKGKGKK